MLKNQQNHNQLQELINEAYQMNLAPDIVEDTSPEIKNKYISIKDESKLIYNKLKIPLVVREVFWNSEKSLPLSASEEPRKPMNKSLKFIPFGQSKRQYVDESFDKKTITDSPRDKFMAYLNFNKYQHEQDQLMTKLNNSKNSARLSNQQSPKLRQRIISQQERTQLEIQKKKKYEDEVSFLNRTEDNQRLETKLLSIKILQYTLTSDTIWKPQIRVGSTLSQIGSCCYLYGGRGQDIFNTICKLDIDTIKWEELTNTTGVRPISGRIGHSSSVYKKSLFIFGGEMHFNSKQKQQECTNSTIQFTPSSNQWLSLRCFGEFVEARRYHTATVVGKFLMIIGGINSSGRFMQDINVLNLETHKWQAMEADKIMDHGLAFHQSQSVYQGDVHTENPYQQYETYNKQDQGNLKVKYEGIYIFGGQNSKGILSNTLSILQFGYKPLKWFIPITNGQPPIARYQHTINYLRELQVLIICGGRNDELLTNAGFDVQMIQLDTMTWLNVMIIGQVSSNRRLHNSVQVDQKLIIFGGSYNEYMNPDLLIIEFDFDKIKYLNRMKRKDGKILIQIHEILDVKEILWMDTSIKLNPIKEEKSLNQFLLKNYQTQWDKMQYNSLKTFLPLPQRESSQLIKKFLVKRYTKNILDQSLIRVQTSRDEIDRSHAHVPHVQNHIEVPTLESQLTRKIQKKIQNKEMLEKWVDSCVNRIMSHVD